MIDLDITVYLNLTKTLYLPIEAEWNSQFLSLRSVHFFLGVLAGNFQFYLKFE